MFLILNRIVMLCLDAAEWRKALKLGLNVEMTGLYQRGVFSVVDPPDNHSILGTTIVFKSKLDPSTGTTSYKARLCL